MTINELCDWLKAHDAALRVTGEGSRCETLTIRARALGDYYEVSRVVSDAFVADATFNAREEVIKRLMRQVEAVTD